MKRMIMAAAVTGIMLSGANGNPLPVRKHYHIKAVCPWQTFKVIATARPNGKLYLEFNDPKAPLGYVYKLCDTSKPICQVGRCKVYLKAVEPGENNTTE